MSADAESLANRVEQQLTSWALLNAGGSLQDDWECSLRFRVTSRRHGRQGLTTDNYYYSPCGKTFRTHKQVSPQLWCCCVCLFVCEAMSSYAGQVSSLLSIQSSHGVWCVCFQVAEFLGLQLLSKEQLKQQEADVPERFNIVSVTALDAACYPTSTSTVRQSGKRSHSAMAATDTAAHGPDCSQAQRAAASAPAAMAATSAQTVSCSLTPSHSSQQAGSVVSAPASSQQYPVKHTKAALAAKYAGSCSSVSAVSASTAMASVGVTVTATLTGLPSCNSTATQAVSMTASDTCRQPAGADAATHHDEQRQLQLAPARPAASSNTSSKSSSGSKAVSSRLVIRPAAQQQVPQGRQQQHVAPKQPVPKPWKPRAQPAWRVKLRELATAAVLAEGLGPAPKANSA